MLDGPEEVVALHVAPLDEQPPNPRWRWAVGGHGVEDVALDQPQLNADLADAVRGVVRAGASHHPVFEDHSAFPGGSHDAEDARAPALMEKLHQLGEGHSREVPGQDHAGIGAGPTLRRRTDQDHEVRAARGEDILPCEALQGEALGIERHQPTIRSELDSVGHAYFAGASAQVRSRSSFS